MTQYQGVYWNDWKRKACSLLRWAEDKDDCLELPGGERQARRQRETGNCHGNMKRIQQKVNIEATILNGIARTKKRGNMIHWKEYSFTTKGLRCDSSSTIVPVDTLTATFHLPLISLWVPFRGNAPTLPTHVDWWGSPPFPGAQLCTWRHDNQTKHGIPLATEVRDLYAMQCVPSRSNMTE